MEKLKPCPFCGEAPTFDTDGHMTWVYCYRCDVRGPRVWNGKNAKKEATEKWNRRPNDE